MLATRFGREAQRRQVFSHHALSEDDLQRIVPSVFAEGAHESRSARYTYIPTIEVLRGLFREGFAVFSATQALSRIEGKTAYTKHMLRLRHAEQLARSGADVNEVILINSHDGTSSYQMLAGCFRFVCSNGLVVGDVPLRDWDDTWAERFYSTDPVSQRLSYCKGVGGGGTRIISMDEARRIKATGELPEGRIYVRAEWRIDLRKEIGRYFFDVFLPACLQLARRPEDVRLVFNFDS